MDSNFDIVFKQLNVRLDEKLIKDFKSFALEHDTNINTLVSRALELYLMCQYNSSYDFNFIDLDHVNRELKYYILNDENTVKILKK